MFFLPIYSLQPSYICNTKEITTAKQLVIEIKITPESATVQIGETLDLAVTISPEDAYNRAITWNSSNPDVATIDQNGKVTAVTEGTTTITAIAQDGSNVQGSCTIKVEDSILYLYNEGDECNDVTGGWTFRGVANGANGESISKQTNHFLLLRSRRKRRPRIYGILLNFCIFYY